MRKDKILIIGAFGQLGSELSLSLKEIYGEGNVIISDIRDVEEKRQGFIFEQLNVLDSKKLAEIVDKYQITQIYHLAAVLSASAEQDPLFGWQINMDGTLNVLEIAREKGIEKVYYPSSIAVFGQDTPKKNTPQSTIMNPNTIYGISKQASERWCEYYFLKYGLDVRSLRYPGLISYKTPPGGGTTDYAVDIFYKAIRGKSYECFLSENTYLPMMYMPDAIKATLDLMHNEADKIKVRSSYNLSAMSFSPAELATTIQKFIPDFQITYKPDFRQAIADSWSDSVDDSKAREDWGWQEDYDIARMTEDMLANLKKRKEEEVLV